MLSEHSHYPVGVEAPETGGVYTAQRLLLSGHPGSDKPWCAQALSLSAVALYILSIYVL